MNTPFIKIGQEYFNLSYLQHVSRDEDVYILRFLGGQKFYVTFTNENGEAFWNSLSVNGLQNLYVIEEV